MLREVQLREVRPGSRASSTLATWGVISCSKALWILPRTLEFSSSINYRETEPVSINYRDT